MQKKSELLLKSESSKAVRRKVQNIDIGPGFQGSADENNTGSNIDIDMLMDYKIQQKKLKNKFLKGEDDSDFTNLPEILEEDDDDIPDFEFSAVETNVTVQPSSPAGEPKPIKQFKRISHKKEGNYYLLVKCLLPRFHSIQIWHMYHQIL